MANEVFANDLEIACKAADGMSSCSFPDPCWSPPSPSAGWILIPYANTAYAKDTANASKTVFISGKPIIKKDISYFKTSTGNEPAAGPKGQKTGVKKGKAYFRSWSMNVKVEGENVCRHTDTMTHNHASFPGNTPLWKYKDTKWNSINDCKKEEKRLNKACGKNERHINLNWKQRHCKFLSFKPTAKGFKGLEKPAKLLKELESRIADANIMEAVAKQAMDAATDLAFKMAVKLGAKFVAGKAIPVAGWIYSAFTAAEDFAEASYYKEMYTGAQEEYQRITSEIGNVKKDIQDTIEALKNGDLEAAGNKIADWQRDAATVDACLRARKCMLVPMSDTNNRSGGMRHPKGKGCCPGQTGHHLIPHSFVKKAGCSKYKYNKAPVVCAEGTTQNHGSHGALHTATTEMIVPKGDWGSDKTSSASYEDVRDGAIKAHAKTFPFSTCSRSCLKEQLDNYYKSCNDLTVKQIGQNPAGSDTGGMGR